MKQDENGVYWEDGKIEYTNDTHVLTREQMKEIYPMRWVGLTNVSGDSACIRSGTVVAFGDKSELLLLQIDGKLDYVTFTTRERLGSIINILD